MSHEGVTCCGPSPTRNVRTTRNVRGLMTDTESAPLFGTYTRGGNRPAALEILPLIPS